MQDKREDQIMPTTTTNPHGLHIPAGAVEVAEWTDNTKPLGAPPTDHTNPNASRYFSGSSWTVDRSGHDIRVLIDGLQHTSGRIERFVVIDDDNFTVAEARRLARVPPPNPRTREWVMSTVSEPPAEGMQRRKWIPDPVVIADELITVYRNADTDDDGDLDAISTMTTWQGITQASAEEFTVDDWLAVVQELARRAAKVTT
jgi:hypothetical protein